MANNTAYEVGIVLTNGEVVSTHLDRWNSVGLLEAVSDGSRIRLVDVFGCQSAYAPGSILSVHCHELSEDGAIKLVGLLKAIELGFTPEPVPAPIDAP